MSSMKNDIQIKPEGSALCINNMCTWTLFGIVIILTERPKPL
ncbi:MAG: hypothetical protein ACYTFK_12965 [Planctomycetota bacterium]